MSSIDISEKDGVRYLHFGSEWVQGAMRLRDPYALELQYARDMLCGLLLRPAPWPREALTIGLGAGSLTKFVHRHCADTRQTVVEIDARVHAAARHLFELPTPDARLSIEIGDGAAFIEADGPAFDCILVDGYDAEARTGALDTAGFYVTARERLSPQGLIAVNLFGNSHGFEASLARIMDAFGERVLALPPCNSGNAIVLAAVGEPIEFTLDVLHERAAALRERTGLDLAPTLSRLQRSGRVPGDTLIL